jgi:hypothetical protein
VWGRAPQTPEGPASGEAVELTEAEQAEIAARLRGLGYVG